MRITAICDRYRDGVRISKDPVEIDLVSHDSLRKINNKEIYTIAPLEKAGALGIIYFSHHKMSSALTRIDSIQMWVGPEIAARNEASILDNKTLAAPSRVSRARI